MITGPQIKAARSLLGIDQRTLADRAGLSVPTIQRMEAASGTVGGTVDSMTRVINAFENAGVELINESAASSGAGRGVRLLHVEADRSPDDPDDPDDTAATERDEA